MEESVRYSPFVNNPRQVLTDLVDQIFCSKVVALSGVRPWCGRREEFGLDGASTLQRYALCTFVFIRLSSAEVAKLEWESTALDHI